MSKLNNQTNQFLSFEKSAYNFIEELKDISLNIQLLPAHELRKAALLVACVKNLMSCIKKDIEDVETGVKRK